MLSGMRVVVCGGGIGGLALAQGLVRRGLEVVVLERDEDLAQTGGYKLHLAPAPVRALADLLPADQMGELLDRAVRTTGFTLAVRDHRARLLVRAREDEQGQSVDVDRITLRRALAAGLGDRLRLGQQCARYTESGNGAHVELASGERVVGDVVVIAEGAGSRLARQLAGARTCSSTGLVGVAGRTLVSDLPQRAQQIVREDPLLAFGPGGVGLFASWHAPGAGSGALTPPMVIWGMLTVASRPPAGASEDLARAAAGLLARARWAPGLVDLPRHAAPGTVASFPLLAADPGRIAPWVPRRVTAMGDAAHAMPPTGGQGAATAILDAHQHTTVLAETAEGQRELGPALQAAAHEMRTRSATAVRESLAPVRWIKASAHPAGTAATTLAMPAAAGIAALARSLRGAVR